ncbi:MAG: phytanoyl-CoA dioxygenase family protein [Polaromonas sp.]|nr:phytanoyl-CoA dioxygenase family protein [Polaromonas sp.]
MTVQAAASPAQGARGFHIARIFEAAEVQGMRDAIADTVDAAARGSDHRYAASLPDAGVFDRVEQVAQTNVPLAREMLSAVYKEAHRDPRIACLQDDDRLRAAVTTQCGNFEPTGVIVRVRCSVPAIPSTLHGWHSDVAINRAVREDSTCHTVLAACWIPLQDVHPGNGSLEVVRSSFTAPVAHVRPESGGYVIADATLAGLPRQSIWVRAGEAAVIDRFTPHRSLPNPGPQVRWSVVAWVKGTLR